MRLHVPPAAQIGDLRLEGEQGWRSVNRFSVAWRNPSDGGAPLAAAHYTLCPVGGGACVEGAQAGAGIDTLGLAVPAPGEYRLRVWLEDAAGNADPHRAAPPVALRFDDEAPTAAFDALDAAD